MRTLQESILDIDNNVIKYGDPKSLYNIINGHIVKFYGNRSGGLGYTHAFDIKKTNAFIKSCRVPVLDTISGRLKSQAPKQCIEMVSAIASQTILMPVHEGYIEEAEEVMQRIYGSSHHSYAAGEDNCKNKAAIIIRDDKIYFLWSMWGNKTEDDWLRVLDTGKAGMVIQLDDKFMNLVK